MGTPADVSSSNTPTKRIDRQQPAWIEKGTVANVDMRNWTVDLISEYSSKYVPRVQIMCPYLEATNGAGIYVMPEVGTVAVYITPSDGDPPFVVGFLGVPKSESSQQDDLVDKAGDPGVETEEDLPSPVSTQSTGATKPASHGGSFRSNRPDLNPGDMALVGHDGNFIFLRRGGVIQIGATPTCQSIFIPVLNYLRQFCENYEMSTPGGALFWKVERQENDPGGEAPVSYRLSVRDKAQNDKADVQIRFGHIDDDIRYELVVAPKNVNVADGETGNATYTIQITKDGNIDVVANAKLTEKYGNRETTITGTDKLTTGIQEIKVLGSKSEEIMGPYSFKAATSSEILTGTKIIDATLVKLGNGPLEPSLFTTRLLTWLARHSHDALKAPPSTAAELPTCVNTKLLVPKP